jgi:hypothetical protein
MGTLAVAQWARINDVRLSRFSLVSDHAVYRAIAWSSRRRLRAADHSSLPPPLHSWPFVYNVQLDRSCFLIAAVEHANENLRPDKPGLSRIMQFGSGRFVVKDFISIVALIS